MDIIAKTCSTNCFGICGYHGSCCRIENRNWIIGPIHDTEEVLERLRKRNPSIEWEDCFIAFEEGKELYPDKEVWQYSENYPAMRPREGDCTFYNSTIRGCSIYSERPETCRTFICDHLAKEMINDRRFE